MRSVRLIISSALVGGGAIFAVVHLRTLEVRRLTAQVNELEEQRQELRDYIRRLSAWRRVAQIDVLDQRPDQRGWAVSAIVWHEISRDGVLSEPQTVEVVGELMYVEAAVIKFEHEHVGKGDPEKSGSVAVFRRIFGDRQVAASVPNLNLASRPVVSGSPSEEPLQARLWSLFWQLMSDPKLAQQYGVRVAQCEAPAVKIKPGQIWEVTLDAAGGLNLRLIGERREITLATQPPHAHNGSLPYARSASPDVASPPTSSAEHPDSLGGLSGLVADAIRSASPSAPGQAPASGRTVHWVRRPQGVTLPPSHSLLTLLRQVLPEW